MAYPHVIDALQPQSFLPYGYRYPQGPLVVFESVTGDPGGAPGELNGIENASFHTTNLAEDHTEASWAGGGYNKVLLDPPRSGAAEVMDVLGNIGPQRIVYVSCHPGSLARDAGTLVNDKGYRLLSAGVMDMFPHTAHVESIALFAAQ